MLEIIFQKQTEAKTSVYERSLTAIKSITWQSQGYSLSMDT